MGIVRFSCRMVMQKGVPRAGLLDKRCSRRAGTLHEMHRPEYGLREQVRCYRYVQRSQSTFLIASHTTSMFF